MGGSRYEFLGLPLRAWDADPRGARRGARDILVVRGTGSPKRPRSVSGWIAVSYVPKFVNSLDESAGRGWRI